MRLYFVRSQELIKSSPAIDCLNLKADGIIINAPGTIIFRTREEAQAAIDAAHTAMAMNQQAEAQK